MLYEKNTQYSTTEILRNCCESALLDLDVDNVGEDIHQLHLSGYTHSVNGFYTIAPKGIAYVRKLIASIGETTRAGEIPQHMIAKQDLELKKQIEKQELDESVFVKVLLKNISLVWDLIKLITE